MSFNTAATIFADVKINTYVKQLLSQNKTGQYIRESLKEFLPKVIIGGNKISLDPLFDLLTINGVLDTYIDSVIETSFSIGITKVGIDLVRKTPKLGSYVEGALLAFGLAEDAVTLGEDINNYFYNIRPGIVLEAIILNKKDHNEIAKKATDEMSIEHTYSNIAISSGIHAAMSYYYGTGDLLGGLATLGSVDATVLSGLLFKYGYETINRAQSCAINTGSSLLIDYGSTCIAVFISKKIIGLVEE